MRDNMKFWQERVDLAAAFRWAARLNMHEGVANHFSLAINDDGTKFLMNPNQAHFSRIKASDMIIVDANDPETLTGLSGFGDLALTCTSAGSRNYRFGQSIGAGQAFDQNTTVEGAATAISVSNLAQKHDLDLPICRVVADLSSGKIDPETALTTLLSRPLKKE